MTDTGALYSAAQAERLLDIPAVAVRQWAHRGQIEPAGYYWSANRKDKKPLFRFVDLMSLNDRRLARNGNRSTVAA